MAYVVASARVFPVSIIVCWGLSRCRLFLSRMPSSSFGSESGVEGGRAEIGVWEIVARVAPGLLPSLLTAKNGVYLRWGAEHFRWMSAWMKIPRRDLAVSGQNVWGIPSSGDGNASFPCVCQAKRMPLGTRPCIQNSRGRGRVSSSPTPWDVLLLPA